MSVHIGICAIVRNEARYIEEWLAFHILQGVSHIVLYDNGSTDETRDIVSAFSAYLDISIVHWPVGDRSFDQCQRLAYKDGAKRLEGLVEFVAFIDADEFLFGSDGVPLVVALERFGSTVGAIAITQRVFGSSGQRSYTPDLVISRFVYCSGLTNSESHWFKTIARPANIADFDSVHSVQLSKGDYVMSDLGPFLQPFPHPGFANRAVNGIIQLNHYMLKSYEEFGWKRDIRRATDSADRYVETYFSDRDRFVNEEYDVEARKLRRKVVSLVSEISSPHSHVRIRQLSSARDIWRKIIVMMRPGGKPPSTARR